MFIYFWERERERARVNLSGGGAETGGDTESKAGLSCQHRARLRARTHEPDHDLSQSLTLNLLSHPGALFFILEREYVQVGERGREREKERENLKVAPCSVKSLMRGSIPRCWDHDLRRYQESDALLTESPTCPSNYLLMNRWLIVNVFTEFSSLSPKTTGDSMSWMQNERLPKSFSQCWGFAIPRQ